jgi:NAD(P)-dependent dehydrogenase (short-subunit alcohol dehydrogenase family)
MQNRVVVVTGAFGTLGSAVARTFAAARATVALLDRSALPADMAREFGGSHVIVHDVDLASPEAAVRAAFQMAGGACGAPRSEDVRITRPRPLHLRPFGLAARVGLRAKVQAAATNTSTFAAITGVAPMRSP